MKLLYLRLFLVLTLTIFYLVGLAQPQNNTFSRLFIFGDSLTDVGNSYKLFDNSIPESTSYYNGRFSNGPVWIEYFSKELNFPPELVINFAFAGARAIKDPVPVPSLDQQVAKYLKWNPNGADPNALYIVWIGSNDIINDEFKCHDSTVVKNISKQVKNQLELLIKHGAKTFLIPNLPAISVTPMALEHDVIEYSTRYSRHIEQMTINYNKFLQSNLNALLRKYSNVKFLRFDSYSLLKNADDYADFSGIKNTNQRCNPNWYTYNYFRVCSNPREYLFWDAVHPTTAGHFFISFFISNIIYSSGYSSIEDNYFLTYQDKKIYNNNRKGLQELTTNKLSLSKYEVLLRYGLWF